MLRIVGGSLRGQKIQVPNGKGLRPTSEKVREALFDRLAQWSPLEDAAVLDLYAGSGALGIEALSRGAPHATFVESSPRSASGIRRNLERLGLPQGRWQVVCARVESWLKRMAPLTAPTVILLDPPYQTEDIDRVLALLAGLEAIPAGTLMTVELAARRPLEPPVRLELLKAKRYGDTQLVILGKRAPATPPPSPDRDP